MLLLLLLLSTSASTSYPLLSASALPLSLTLPPYTAKTHERFVTTIAIAVAVAVAVARAFSIIHYSRRLLVSRLRMCAWDMLCWYQLHTLFLIKKNNN